MPSYPRFTPTQRRKLTMSARARESFRAVGIRGGAGPGEGAPVAPQGYYSLSEDDRALIEQVIADNQADDPLKRKEALKWWSNALKDIPTIAPFAAVAGATGAGGFIAGQALGTFIIDFFGYEVLQPFDLPEGATFARNDSWAAALTDLSVSEPSGDNRVQVSFGAAFSILDWSCLNQTLGEQETTLYSSQPIEVLVADVAGETSIGLGGGGGSQMRVPGFRGPECPFPGYEPGDNIGPAVWTKSAGGVVGIDSPTLCVSARIFDSTGTLATSPEVCPGGTFSGLPEFGAPEAISVGPEDLPTLPVDPCDLVDLLRDYPYAPPPGAPPGTPPITPPPGTPPITPPITPLPGDEPPTQPPDPGTNPFPGQPPIDPTPDGECFIDATTISAAAVDALKSGVEGAWSARTNDNAERLYAPQGSDGCRDFDPIDEAGMINALVAEGWTTSAQSGGFDGCSVDATTISQNAVAALTSGGTNPWTSDPNDNQERLYAPAGTNGSRKFDPIDERYLIDALQAEGWMFYEDGSGLPPASWCTGGGGGPTHICPPSSWCASSPPPGVPPGVPIPPIVPPGPIVPTVPGTDPIEDGIDDPGEGGCMTLSKEPAGFRDPKQAGGIARKYQPGQPMVIDYGEGSRCKTKIVKVKPKKGEDGGPEICVGGGIDNGGKTTEKTCYGPGLVTEAIQSVLGEMVAEGGSIIFDSDCDRELHRPLCFRPGTSKRVILNKLLDMCGFCIFPQFDCNVIVGYCGPLRTVWTYHEDVDLIKFDLEYDGQEVYDYVEVFRGDWISRAGNVFVPGNSVLYPVGSPASSVSGDRVYQYEVPYSTPDSELNSIAISLAAKLRSQALPEIAFGVPLNSQLAARHQLRIQMPSVGFDAYYMVTRPARDYDRENGHLSVGLARWLRAAP